MSVKNKKATESDLFCSDSGGTQTRDPQFRRLLLYSAELPNLLCGCKVNNFSAITEIYGDYYLQKIQHYQLCDNHPQEHRQGIDG